MNAGSIRKPIAGAMSLAPEGIASPRERLAPDMGLARARGASSRSERIELSPAQAERFNALYREHFDFVFRNLRRLGVPSEGVDDALQEVYLVALRRIDDLHEDSSPRAWLFAIAQRVASTSRRTDRRRGHRVELAEAVVGSPAPSALDMVERAEAGRVLHAFLETLNETSRAIFIMTELEQMTAPEISRALSMNVNTIYTRLQVARASFAQVAARVARGRRFGGAP